MYSWVRGKWRNEEELSCMLEDLEDDLRTLQNRLDQALLACHSAVFEESVAKANEVVSDPQNHIRLSKILSSSDV